MHSLSDFFRRWASSGTTTITGGILCTALFAFTPAGGPVDGAGHPGEHPHIIRQRARLQAHFRRVLHQMAGRDTSTLTAVQKSNRLQRMDDLREYSHRGRFPLNLENPGRTLPYIRDARGTLCAMAYLMDKGGAGHVVRRLAMNNNHVYMNDIKDGPVIAWLKRNGMTRGEAADIQPRYDHMRRKIQIRPRSTADAHGDGMDSGYFHRGLLKRTRVVPLRRPFQSRYIYSRGRLTAFMGAQDGLYAYHMASQRLKWKAAAQAPVVHTPVVIRGHVYANVQGIGTGMWDAENGRLVRMFPIPGGPAGSPLLLQEARSLVIVGNDKRVRFFDVNTGHLTRVQELKRPLVGSPGIVAGRIIVTLENEILALDKQGTQILWRVQLPGKAVHEPPAYGHRLFVPAGTRVLILNASDGGRLGMLDAKDDIRRVRMPGFHKLTVLTASGRLLVFNTTKNEPIAAASPGVTYRDLLPAFAGVSFGGPSIVPVRSSSHYIAGISARGELRAHPIQTGTQGWSLRLQAPSSGAAIVPGGQRFLMTDTRGYMYIINRNGSIAVKIKQASAFTSRPVLAD